MLAQGVERGGWWQVVTVPPEEDGTALSWRYREAWHAERGQNAMGEALATDGTALGIRRRKVWVVSRFVPCNPEVAALQMPGIEWCTIAARTSGPMAVDLARSLADEQAASSGSQVATYENKDVGEFYFDLVRKDDRPERTADYTVTAAYRVTELVLGAEPL